MVSDTLLSIPVVAVPHVQFVSHPTYVMICQTAPPTSHVLSLPVRQSGKKAARQSHTYLAARFAVSHRTGIARPSVKA